MSVTAAKGFVASGVHAGIRRKGLDLAVVRSTTPAVGAAVSAPGTTPAAADHSAVPDSLAFTAPRVGDGTINMADFAGKPVLLWFWAPT